MIWISLVLTPEKSEPLVPRGVVVVRSRPEWFGVVRSSGRSESSWVARSCLKSESSGVDQSWSHSESSRVDRSQPEFELATAAVQSNVLVSRHFILLCFFVFHCARVIRIQAIVSNIPTPTDTIPDGFGRLRTTPNDSERLQMTLTTNDSSQFMTTSNDSGQLRTIPDDSKRLRPIPNDSERLWIMVAGLNFRSWFQNYRSRHQIFANFTHHYYKELYYKEY